MTAFVWEPWELPENKDATTELPDGFIASRYVMGEDINAIFLALTELASAVRLAGGILAPQAAPPVAADGTFTRGHIVWNSLPSPGAPSGWICTESGTPGTWESLAYTAGTVEGAQSYYAEGETLKLAGATESYIGIYPDDDLVRAQVGFTGYPGIDPEENPADYAHHLYLRNTYSEEGHIILEPGLDGEVYVGNYVSGTWGGIATFGATRFLAGGNGAFIDATAARVRFPRGSAAPTAGTYAVGDLFFNDTTPGSHVGWVCTAAGTPGTWQAFGPPASPTLDHGALFGMLDDDHPQYALADGTRGVFASVGHDHDEDYASLAHTHAGTYATLAHDHDEDYAAIVHDHDLAYSPTGHNHDLNYSAIAHTHAGTYQALDADLSAIAALTGTGILERTGDGTWALGSGGTGVEDHGDLTGLADDDHTQYAKTDGTRTITGTQRLGPTSTTGSNWPTRSFAVTGDDLVDTIGFAWSIEDGVRNARGSCKVDPAANEITWDFTYTTGANYEYVWKRDSTELVRFGNNGFTATGIDLRFATAGTGVRYPGGDLHTSGTAAPTTGTHTQGEVVWNQSPEAGGTLGWVCTTAGTPGTWGSISLASGGVSDHGALLGLSDDDHTQYALLTGGVRGAFTGAISSTGTIRSTAAGIGFDQENGGIRYQSFVGSGFAWMGSYSNHPFAFFTNNGFAQAILETNGALSVGFTAAQSPTSKLLVNGVLEGTALKSTVATGTAPLTVASTTKVTNLNADLLDGLSSADFALAGHDHAATYQPLDSDLTAISGATLTGDGVLTRTGGTWSIEAGGGGGVTDHGALTGLSDDDHTQYLLADGSRVLAALSLSGAIDRSTGAALSIGTTTATGVNIGRSGQANTITGSQTTFVGADSSYPWRLTDGTHTLSAWVGTSSNFECEFGTETNHSLTIYVNNASPLWRFALGGDFELLATGSATGGGIQFNATGNRMVSLGTTSAPASGTWATGDIVWSTTAAVDGPVGWRCTSGGTPGTWKAFGYIADELKGTATWNPGSVAAAADLGTTVTVTGAAVGDYVLGISHDQLTTQEVVLHGSVTAANTVSVILHNRSSGAVDLASGTLSVIVRKRT